MERLGCITHVECDVQGGVIGTPEELFTAKDKKVVLSFLGMYETGPDDRLLVVQSVGDEIDAPAVVLVDNWLAEFEQDRR